MGGHQVAESLGAAVRRILRPFVAFVRGIRSALGQVDSHDVMLYGGILAVGVGAAWTYGDGVGLMVGGGLFVAWAFLPALQKVFGRR